MRGAFPRTTMLSTVSGTATSRPSESVISRPSASVWPPSGVPQAVRARAVRRVIVIIVNLFNIVAITPVQNSVENDYNCPPPGPQAPGGLIPLIFRALGGELPYEPPEQGRELVGHTLR